MSPVAITGIGAVTPVGLSAAASCAAFRAAVSGVNALESSEPDGPAGPAGPPVGGRVPLEWFHGGPEEEIWPAHERFKQPLPEPAHMIIPDGVQRLIDLALPAAMECWNRADLRAPEKWGVFLGIGEEEDATAGDAIARALFEAWGSVPTYLDVTARGRAAGLFALNRAIETMEAGHIGVAIVGNVDSLVRPAVRKKLDDDGLLKPENPHGIIPGEAAAFIVLEARPRATPLAFVTASAAAEEPTAGTEEPNRAEGLTEVLRITRQQAPLEHAPLVICDLNGERYRALEWGLALTRSLGDLAENPASSSSGEFWHPADCTGDTGSASGVLDIVWAVESFSRAYAETDQILVWGASDSGLRAAAMIQAGGQQ